MERLSNNAIDIIDELHTERLHYFNEYIPLIDAANLLAEYEDTGLTPKEIKELQGDTLKKLKESNEILRKNNDEYYEAYQKLLNENRKLKSLLKCWLEDENF